MEFVRLLQLIILFSPLCIGAQSRDDTLAQIAFPEQAPSVKPRTQTPPVELGEVDSSGAFGYKVPPRVPPGRNGLLPSFSVAYSRGNAQDSSFAGAGWSLRNTAGSVFSSKTDG